MAFGGWLGKRREKSMASVWICNLALFFMVVLIGRVANPEHYELVMKRIKNFRVTWTIYAYVNFRLVEMITRFALLSLITAHAILLSCRCITPSFLRLAGRGNGYWGLGVGGTVSGCGVD